MGFEQGFGLSKGGCQEGVAVAGEHYLPGLEVEGDDGYELLGDGEAVDDGIGDVLVLHNLEHRGDHHIAGRIVGLQQVVLRQACIEQLAHFLGSHLCQLLFVGLGIVVILIADETVAVAYEPHLMSVSAVDDGRGGEALFGMLRHALFGESEPVVAGDGAGDAFAELLTADVGWHAADIAAYELHGISPVAHPGAMVNGGL